MAVDPMTTAERPRPVQPGEPAPDFTLPAVHRDGEVSLAEYRGRSPVLLALFRGLYCPYCRWHISRLRLTAEKLTESGVQTLAVVATAAERARLYYRFRPAGVALGADPELITHRAYGVPHTPTSPDIKQLIRAKAGELARERQAPAPDDGALDQLNRLDGFTRTEGDQAESQRHGLQFTAQFLVDRHGIVCWTNIECAAEGMAGFEKFPSSEELLGAARTLR